MKFKVRSFTNKDEWYNVDCSIPFCSCNSFKYNNYCKHLSMLTDILIRTDRFVPIQMAVDDWNYKKNFFKEKPISRII